MASAQSTTDDTTTGQPVVCVFCASSSGSNPAHLESARRLATHLAAAGYRLVYGGGTLGIMGEVAKTFVAHTSPESVEGVIPRALIKTEKDPSTRNDGSPAPSPALRPATGPTESKEPERVMTRQQLERADTADVIPAGEFGRTTVVTDMHSRKKLMATHVIKGGPGSGFVALAGGYGTAEEVMEMVTWNQLGIHQMPIVLVNIDGYWDGLLQWVRNSVKEGFVAAGNSGILVEVKEPEQVVEALRSYRIAGSRFKLDWS